MKRVDIFLVSLDPRSGHEQKGSRPVLVVTPEAFNRLTKTPIVVSITNGGNFARMAGFTINLEELKTTDVVRCDQPRVLDLVARNARKLESVPTEIMDEVLVKLGTLIS